MADIFLSYAREDLAKAQFLAVVMQKQGWSVFWDRSALLAGQDIEEIIEREIDQAKCMIVAWSSVSKRSDWVRGEADIGRQRRILVPVLFEAVGQPIAFRALHTEDLVQWNGEVEHEAIGKLLRAVERLVGPAKIAPSPVQTADTIPNSTPKPRARTAVKPRIFIEPEMAVIPAGRFQMGSDKGSDDERPCHLVTIDHSFSLAKYLVTFYEYDLYANAKSIDLPPDRDWGRDKRPVINVSWNDASAYAVWLSEQTGKRYRLPSEAEWEYAARAGTTGDHYWGANDPKDYAWFSENSNQQTHPVGQKQPNAFGLYDMAGNVWEWVQDCWHENYDNAPTDGTPWQQKNNGDCTWRVLRGGSWSSEARLLRSANRYRFTPAYRYFFVGFRLAQD